MREKRLQIIVTKDDFVIGKQDSLDITIVRRGSMNPEAIGGLPTI